MTTAKPFWKSIGFWSALGAAALSAAPIVEKIADLEPGTLSGFAQQVLATGAAGLAIYGRLTAKHTLK